MVRLGLHRPQKEIVHNFKAIDTGAIRIIHAMEVCKASAGRRVHDPHEPLLHAVIRLTVFPFPFDQGSHRSNSMTV